MAKIVGQIGNYVLVDLLRMMSTSFAGDTNTHVYVDVVKGVVVRHNEWVFNMTGDGVVYVSNDDYPEVPYVCCDDHAYYAQGKKDFLEVCREQFMKEVKSREVDREVDEIVAIETKIWVDSDVPQEYKNKELREINSMLHRMDVRKWVMLEMKDK